MGYCCFSGDVTFAFVFLLLFLFVAKQVLPDLVTLTVKGDLLAVDRAVRYSDLA